MEQIVPVKQAAMSKARPPSASRRSICLLSRSKNFIMKSSKLGGFLIP